MEFYERIRLLRKQKGLTQSQLATDAGVSAPYISHVETGKKSPTVRKLKIIAYSLNVSVAELFGCKCCA